MGFLIKWLGIGPDSPRQGFSGQSSFKIPGCVPWEEIEQPDPDKEEPNKFTDCNGNLLSDGDSVLLPSGQYGGVILTLSFNIPHICVVGENGTGADFDTLSQKANHYTFRSHDKTSIYLSDIEKAFGTDENGNLKGLLLVRRGTTLVAGEDTIKNFLSSF